MKIRVFLKNAAVLTLCSLMLSAAGMALRVYQTSVIGAEGMGLLQLLLSVYYFATNLAVSGLNLAVTRLISEAQADHTVPVRTILRKCFALCIGSGGTAGILLFVAAPILGEQLLGDARTVPSLRVLAVGLPLLAVSCCCRGYFLAMRNSLKPCLGQVLEQVAGFGATAVLLPLLAPKGLSYACCGIAAGMTLGELCGNLYIVWMMCLERRRMKKPTEIPSALCSRTATRQNGLPIRRILAISMPIALGYDLRSALIAVENVLVPAGLKQCGSSYAESLASYGIVKGMALPTIQFPAAFLTAFSLLLIPEIAQSRTAGHPDEIRLMARRVFRICLAFSSFVTAGFLFYGDDLGRVLYGNTDAGRMMRLLCPLVPFMYLDSIVDAMLKGLDEQMYSLKVNLSDSCIRIVLMVVLLPRIGLNGYLAATYCSILYNASLSIFRLVRKSRLHVDALLWIFAPMLCAAACCLWSALLVKLIPPLCNAPLIWNLTARMVLAAGLYPLLMQLCGILPRGILRRLNPAAAPGFNPRPAADSRPHLPRRP